MKGIILAAALLAAAQGASAGKCVQLTYLGAPFSSVIATAGNGAANNSNPIYSPLTGLVTLSTPLPANAVNLAVIPAFWTFTEPAAYVPFLVSDGYMNAPWNHATFIFSTDSKGNITDWNIQIFDTIESGPAFTSTVSSSPAGDTAEVRENFITSPLGSVTTTGSSSRAGRWTCPAAISTDYTSPRTAPVDATDSEAE